MKKLLLLPVLCLSLSAGAQGSIQLSDYDNANVLSPNSAILLNTAASSNLKFNIDIKNTSGSTKKYLVKRYDMNLNAGAVAYYCFAGTCYGPGTIQSPDSLLLTAGQSASQYTTAYQVLTSDLDEGPSVGYSLVRYTFFDAFNHSDSVQVTLIYNSPVGLSESKKNLKSVELFPNPSEGNSTLLVTSLTALNGKVMVYNALGDLVSEQNTYLAQGTNKIQLNLQHLTHGVYLVSLTAGNHSLTKRLVIK
jgi:hypothetical protein